MESSTKLTVYYLMVNQLNNINDQFQAESELQLQNLLLLLL